MSKNIMQLGGVKLKCCMSAALCLVQSFPFCLSLSRHGSNNSTTPTQVSQTISWHAKKHLKKSQRRNVKSSIFLRQID